MEEGDTEYFTNSQGLDILELCNVPKFKHRFSFTPFTLEAVRICHCPPSFSELSAQVSTQGKLLLLLKVFATSVLFHLVCRVCYNTSSFPASPITLLSISLLVYAGLSSFGQTHLHSVQLTFE